MKEIKIHGVALDRQRPILERAIMSIPGVFEIVEMDASYIVVLIEDKNPATERRLQQLITTKK